MKKLFSKIDSTSQQNPLIGKVFTVGKYHVTVEDVIAQGNVYMICFCRENFYFQACTRGRISENIAE